MFKNTNTQGWIVVFAGLGVNIVLGVLYAWGIISAALIDQLGWSVTATQIPYMLACLVFSLSMIPGGSLLDKYGPNLVLMISAVFALIGFTMSGLFLNLTGLTIFFGLLFGLAIGMGYSAPIPTAVKWFSSHKRGLVSGIVVSGFGLAPIFMAPLTSYLINSFGISKTFFILGSGAFIIIALLSRFIKNPSNRYIPDKTPAASQEPSVFQEVNLSWKEVLKTKNFYRLWIMYFCGTFTGLLLIGQMAKIGQEQAGITQPFYIIIIYALFNYLGRIGCGIISDKIGRRAALFIMFATLFTTYIFFGKLTSPLPLFFGIAIAGFNFGGMLTIFPAANADFFGMKNFGVNYGLLMTAYGMSGLLGPLAGGIIRDSTGSYSMIYIIAALLSFVGGAVCMVMAKEAGTLKPALFKKA